MFELFSSSCKTHNVNLFGISHLSVGSGCVAWYKARRTRTQRDRDFKSLLGIRIIWKNRLHYLLLIYFNNKPLHVSCVVLTGCWQQPVNTTHDYTSCCLYRVDPPENEQQVCSKHVKTYYSNKLIVNSAACSFILYWWITIHGQQNIKNKPCWEINISPPVSALYSDACNL